MLETSRELTKTDADALLVESVTLIDTREKWLDPSSARQPYAVDLVNADVNVVALNSGGLDSAILCAMLQKEGKQVHSLHLNTFPTNSAQVLIAAEETARRYCVSHHVMPLDFGAPSNKELQGFMLTSYGALYAHVMIGMIYARLNGMNRVYGGFKGTFMPSEWADRMNKLIDGIGIPIEKAHVVMPFLGIGTYQQLLDETGFTYADLSYTQSCGFSPPCGLCFRCKERAAFTPIKVEEPIIKDPVTRG